MTLSSARAETLDEIVYLSPENNNTYKLKQLKYFNKFIISFKTSVFKTNRIRSASTEETFLKVARLKINWQIIIIYFYVRHSVLIKCEIF